MQWTVHRRYNILSITPDGEAVITELEQAAQAANESLFAGVSAEQRQAFLNVVAQIGRNVGERQRR